MKYELEHTCCTYKYGKKFYIYIYIYIYIYVCIFEREISLCMCYTKTVKQKTQRLFDEFSYSFKFVGTQSFT